MHQKLPARVVTPVIRCIWLALSCAVLATAAACSNNGLSSAPYRVETLVSGGPMHGAKGISFGPDGRLYVCSVQAQSIYRVDVATGETATAVPAPDGECDDIAFAPDGTMAWTAIASSEIRARRPSGDVYRVATRLPLVNPLGYTADGRLFAAQVGIDRFLEIDPAGSKPPRVLAKGIGNLNSFEITADGRLYGPLAGVGAVARIDLESGAIEPVATNLGMLSAVNLDSRGQIYAIGWSSGTLWKIDPQNGAARIVTTLEPPLDNLAIGPDDAVYVSQPARGAILRVDPASGEQRVVVPGNLSMPGGLALATGQERETLVVADDFGFRLVDTESGAVSALADLANFMDPPAATDVALNDDVIVLSDVARSRVYMVDRRTARTLHKWPIAGKPYGVALLDSGDPVVADFAGGKLLRLSRTDRQSREVIAAGLSGPVGLLAAGSSALYVSEALAGRLLRVSLEDGSTVIVREGLDQPEGLTLLADRRIGVVEAGAQRVSAIDPETGATEILASGLPIGDSVPGTPAPVHVPSGIAAGRNGVLYLTSDRDQSVLRLVPR